MGSLPSGLLWHHDAMPATSHGLRRRILIGSVILLFLFIALVLLALPFRSVPGNADAAQSDLTQAVAAIKAGDIELAGEHVRAARSEVDDVRDVTNGVSGRVWSLVPVAGSGVRDVRHLGDALDDVTGALEVVMDLEPAVSGEKASLFLSEGGVDISTLQKVLAGVNTIEDKIDGARSSLDDVAGTSPIVGDATAAARDKALAEVIPAQETLTDLRPLLSTLPGMLGAEKKESYVLALLNPAEQRFSGGAALSFSGMTLDMGRLTRSRVNDVGSNARFFRSTVWQGVKGNPFHGPYKAQITKTTLAPSWPVAGEEVLRAWARLKKNEADGLVAVDVVALARLLEVTGPLDVPGVGAVTADTLVPLTLNSYDRYDLEATEQRRKINRALIPAFLDQLFASDDFIGTATALAEAAKARHLVLYLRDRAAQEAVTKIGFDGDLSATDQDYVGIFTQSTVGTKADYWQRKVISSDVQLRANGSAQVRLRVDLRNEAEPLPPGVPETGYTSRDIYSNVGTFLPEGVKVRRATFDDEPFEPELRDYFGRPYFTKGVILLQGESKTLTLEYDVPNAATVKDGELVYGLDFDNHPTVRPEELSVTVHWPKGFRNADLPEGWVPGKGRSARFDAAQVAGSEQWSLTARSS